MTFIETIYTELKKNNVTKNNNDFSTRFLNRSSKYYSVIKNKKLEANTDVLVNLANRLEQLNKIRSKYVSENQYLQIEIQIANELANRTINQKPNKTLVNNVINALQHYQTKTEVVI